MSFDKEKTRRSAEKSLAQGKIQAAIKDYCLIVENDPKDYNTLNTLGDLYVRTDSKNEAIKCFNKIAEHYNVQGFAHKAIAMYKKILRLQPGSVEIAAKLAPLYQMLGLVAEARSHYLIVAESLQKSGEPLKALDVWGRIADLDPNDTKTRLTLAESYLRENETDKAVHSFIEAGNRLLAKKQTEEALNVFKRALELQPFDVAALSGATNATIELGLPEEAAERLEKAHEVYPDNNEILSLLVQSYVDCENVAAAEEATTKLVDRDPMSYKRQLDVVRLYLKENNVEQAIKVLDFASEMLITNNQEEELLHWVNEILARDPEQLVALRILVRIRTWQRNEEELKNSLERLAEAAQLNQAEEEERKALVELATLFPEDERYIARLRELGEDFAPIKNTEDAAVKPEPDNFGEIVPTFESFSTLSSVDLHAASSDADQEHSASLWQDVTDSGVNVISLENNELEAGANDSNNKPTEISETFQFTADSSSNFAIIEDEDVMIETFNSQIDLPSGAQTIQDGDWSGVADSDSATDVVPATQQKTQKLNGKLSDDKFAGELENIDFYISQNYRDLAVESLNALEKQFGANAEIKTRRERLEKQLSRDSTVSTVKRNQEKENRGTTAGPESSIILAADKVSEKINDGVVASAGFEDLFAELGENLEVANLSTTQTVDFETHYNLGLAYKDMGLVDDAVEEFQNAVKLVSPGDGTPRYLQCCNLIGHCFIEKEMPKLAALWYQRGIEAPGHTDEEYQALRYELGIAYEKAGEKEKALELFADIYAVNVAYRNISEKVRSLQRVS